MLQYDGDRMGWESIFGYVEAKGAVVIYASLAFPWFAGFILHSMFVLGVELSPGDHERLERSVKFLIPGEFVELVSLFGASDTPFQNGRNLHIHNIEGPHLSCIPISRGLWFLVVWEAALR